MKVTINRLRVLEIVAGDKKLEGLPGSKLNYALVKNMKALKAEVETMKESNPQSDEMKKYNEEHQEIVNEEAERDEQGNFVPVGDAQSGRIRINSVTYGTFSSAWQTGFNGTILGTPPQ